MKRLWISIFKREVKKNLKGTIIVKIEPSLFSSEVEIVKIIIYNDCFEQPFVHDIGSIDIVMSFKPIDVAQSFIRYYKESREI